MNKILLIENNCTAKVQFFLQSV